MYNEEPLELVLTGRESDKKPRKRCHELRLWFLLVMATQKIYIKEIKIWAVEVVFFKLDMNDAKLCI